MKKSIIIIFLIISVTGLILYSINKNKKDPTKLTLYGNIEIRQVDLSFRVEGKIEKMLFEEGDVVQKGQLLAYLEPTTYQAAYEKALAQIKLSSENKNNAQNKYSRNIPLCKEGTTSKVDCDDMRNAVNTYSAGIEEAKASAKLAKQNLSDTKIYAPDDGVVMTRIQEPGAMVTPSMPIYTMAKSKPVWVRAYITEPDLGNIKYGMNVNVYTDTTNPQTGQKRQYKGQVGYISPVAEFTPKTVQTTDLRTDLVYRIRVYIYDIDEYLRQGMPVTIDIKLKDKTEKNDSQHKN